MEDIDLDLKPSPLDETADDEEREEEKFDDEDILTFDDVVSFTMLLETWVTLIGIGIFFLFVMTGIF